VVLNTEDPGAAARDGSELEEVTGSIAWYRPSAARITRTIIRVTPKDSMGRCCVPGGRLHRGHNPNNSSGYKPEQAPKARINRSQVLLLGPPAYTTRTSLTPPQVILLVLPHSRYYQLFCWDYLVQA
jgi:hypothetical protein